MSFFFQKNIHLRQGGVGLEPMYTISPMPFLRGGIPFISSLLHIILIPHIKSKELEKEVFISIVSDQYDFPHQS